PSTNAIHASGTDGLISRVRALARPGDAVLFLGAGTIATKSAARAAELARAGELPEVTASFPPMRFADILEDVVQAPRVLVETLRLEEKLRAEFGDRVKLDAALASLVSFRAGGRARFLFEPRTVAEAEATFRRLRSDAIPVFVLGGGTNTLAREG